MPMIASAMATLIVNNLKASNPKITGQAETDLLNSWTQICTGMISHITSAAQVTSTGTAVVSTAPGTAPVTATGTIS